jgi:hypothetical protein
MLIFFDLKTVILTTSLIAILILGTYSPLASAQFQAGGVDKEGSWYAGEGLKQGDYFRYTMCHVDYKECATFEMDFWIKGDKQVGSETKWLAEAVVYDGNKVIKGELELGKVAPEPTGGSPELGVYRGAFKSSIAWLSAFATSDGDSGGKGPKEWTAKSWGKIGNIGGEQVIPTAIETITVKAGTWETVRIAWKTGGYSSKVWVVDDFPFPIKAETWTHVSEGIPPPEYRFELLEYKEHVSESPFKNIKSTSIEEDKIGCKTDYERTQVVKKPTKNFNYQIHVFYGPDQIVQGCSMQWQISFISKYDDTEYLNQVQYDLLLVDKDMKPIRSIAQEEGRQFLYSPSGQALIDLKVKAEPGIARYVVWVYGLAPEGIVPSTPDDYLVIEIPVTSLNGSTQPTPIPSWIKNNAGWWADGSIDDNSFVQGIQYLIKEGIMKIPPTTQGSATSNKIPDWVKNNAGWWADGSIDDNSFVQGIQFLIKEGIMKISTPTKSPSSGSAPETWYE